MRCSSPVMTPLQAHRPRSCGRRWGVSTSSSSRVPPRRALCSSPMPPRTRVRCRVPGHLNLAAGANSLSNRQRERCLQTRLRRRAPLRSPGPRRSPRFPRSRDRRCSPGSPSGAPSPGTRRISGLQRGCRRICLPKHWRTPGDLWGAELRLENLLSNERRSGKVLQEDRFPRARRGPWTRPNRPRLRQRSFQQLSCAGDSPPAELERPARGEPGRLLSQLRCTGPGEFLRRVRAGQRGWRSQEGVAE